MPSEKIKILEFIQYQNSDKVPFIIYADLECLKENTDEWENNPPTSSTAKAGRHIHSFRFFNAYNMVV